MNKFVNGGDVNGPARWPAWHSFLIFSDTIEAWTWADLWLLGTGPEGGKDAPIEHPLVNSDRTR